MLSHHVRCELHTSADNTNVMVRAVDSRVSTFPPQSLSVSAKMLGGTCWLCTLSNLNPGTVNPVICWAIFLSESRVLKCRTGVRGSTPRTTPGRSNSPTIHIRPNGFNMTGFGCPGLPSFDALQLHGLCSELRVHGPLDVATIAKPLVGMLSQLSPVARQGLSKVRESETTIKIKFAFFKGGGQGGREENCPKRYFSWKTPRQ